jgi:hypothetical protein
MTQALVERMTGSRGQFVVSEPETLLPLSSFPSAHRHKKHPKAKLFWKPANSATEADFNHTLLALWNQLFAGNSWVETRPQTPTFNTNPVAGEIRVGSDGVFWKNYRPLLVDLSRSDAGAAWVESRDVLD